MAARQPHREESFSMNKFVASLAAIIFTAVGAGPASATQAPLDPMGLTPLAGFVPPSQAGLACTRYVNKRVTVMPLKCALQCAIDAAYSISRNLPFDNDACDNTWTYSCKVTYENALGKLKQGICMNCLDATKREALYPEYRDVVNTAKEQIFCDSNAPHTFYDGHGHVSENRDTVKCQNQVMRALMKAAKCLNLHCHQKTAEGLFWNKPHINNAACEDENLIKSCKAHFEASTKDLTGCPSCLNRDVVWTSFQQAVDINNGDIYCSDDPTPTPTPTP
jgi:hypothetical protein